MQTFVDKLICYSQYCNQLPKSSPLRLKKKYCLTFSFRYFILLNALNFHLNMVSAYTCWSMWLWFVSFSLLQRDFQLCECTTVCPYTFWWTVGVVLHNMFEELCLDLSEANKADSGVPGMRWGEAQQHAPSLSLVLQTHLLDCLLYHRYLLLSEPTMNQSDSVWGQGILSVSVDAQQSAVDILRNCST